MTTRPGKYGNMLNAELFNKIFSGTTVLVTGHTGFMGAWLSLWLISLGANVIGYSQRTIDNQAIFNAVSLGDKLTDINGDVNNAVDLQECIITNKPKFVFHLAAQPLVRTSYEVPVETFQTNIMGTINLLESIRKTSNVRACVIVTSDKCYENRELEYAYKETDPLGGFDPYSASKGAAELITASYRNSFFNPIEIQKHNVSISTVRAGNVIGGGDWAQYRLLPDCTRSLISEKKIPVRNPESIRPWQHVLEPISGMLLLMSKMNKSPTEFAQAWNFGPDVTSRKVTVKELVSKIISEWGKGGWTDVSKETKNFPHEAKSLMLDSSKAKKLLNWTPVYSIKEAINETVSWYREYNKKTTNMFDFSLSQIENYVKKAKHMNISWVHSSV